MSALQPLRTVLMVADLVESVRLMRQDESGSLWRWQQFVRQVREDLLPVYGGQMAQSLGDGLLLHFDEEAAALQAAMALHSLAETLSAGLPPELGLWLRIGVLRANVLQTEQGLFGAEVLRCAQLAAEAEPGTVALGARTAATAAPTWRLLRPPQAPQRPPLPTDDIRPRVACRLADDAHGLPPGWAEAVVDDLVRAMARSPHWHVCAARSSLGLATRGATAERVAQALGVGALVEVKLRRQGEQVSLRLSLRRVHDAEHLAEDGGKVPLDRPWGDSERLALRFAPQALRALTQQHHGFDLPPALPRLDAYSLLMRAIGQMHRCQQAGMALAAGALQHLSERHPRSPEVAAWQAFWHVHDLTVVQLGRPDADGSARRALEQAGRMAQDHALLLAVQGHWELKVGMNLDAAEQALSAALQRNPNEPLAWMFRAHLHIHDDEPQQARQAMQHALALAPLEPESYFFDCFAAAVFSDAGDHARGLLHARRAVHLRPDNLAAQAQRILSEVWAGEMDAARQHAEQYLQRRPQARVLRLLDSYPGRGRGYVERQVAAYLAAGLPR